ncbi:MAG: type II toxin-antitoxin system RelE/ParE family toxin [Chloroflexi bacterium]|nr:type II toxin-antitoxin system RelE/ParE family toxin [Chloroflexota bacterium]
MDIQYATNRLNAAGLTLSQATRFYGVSIGRKYIQRLAVIRAVVKFDDLYGHRALRLHTLQGDRSGQYAMTLTGNFRLIIERISDDTLRILSVEDYHGD